MPAHYEAYHDAMPAPPRARSDHDALTVLLLAPYAPRGGGMGRMMAYLAEPDGEDPDTDALGPASVTPDVPGRRRAVPGSSATGINAQADRTVFRKIETRGARAAIFSAWFVLAAALRIAAHARRRGRTILHVNMAEGSSVFRKGLLLLWASRLGMPTVLHLHAADIIDFHERLPRPLRAWMCRVFQRADVCIVLGQTWRTWLMRDLRVDPARIEILRNGVPDPGIVAFPAASQPGLLVFLGNLLPRKGLPDLIEALAAPAMQSRAWNLVVAGGGDRTALQPQIDKLGLSDRVRFTGWLNRAEVTTLLARATMVILPSYREALPLVLLEAASLGVPAVTTRTGAIEEVFTDGENAVLVEAGQIQALGAAIAGLIDDPARRARIGRDARVLYERNLSIGVFRSRLLAIYRLQCRNGVRAAAG